MKLIVERHNRDAQVLYVCIPFDRLRYLAAMLEREKNWTDDFAHSAAVEIMDMYREVT